MARDPRVSTPVLRASASDDRPGEPRSGVSAAERPLLSLLACIPDRLGMLSEACRSIVDWRVTLQCADASGVLGLLTWSLREVGWRLPPTVQAWAHARVHAIAMQQLQARASLQRVLSHLEAAGIRCVPFKGPHLAERYYPKGAVRPACDLDILIDPENRWPAEQVLRCLGYDVERPGPLRCYELFRHEIKATKLNATGLELHQHVNNSFGVVVPTAPFLARSTRDSRGSHLALPDDLLLVTVHASASLFLSFKWLMDVKLLCLAASPADVQEALTQAQACQVLSPFVFGLREV
jgi:hypothetical protein